MSEYYVLCIFIAQLNRNQCWFYVLLYRIYMDIGKLHRNQFCFPFWELLQEMFDLHGISEMSLLHHCNRRTAITYKQNICHLKLIMFTLWSSSPVQKSAKAVGQMIPSYTVDVKLIVNDRLNLVQFEIQPWHAYILISLKKIRAL